MLNAVKRALRFMTRREKLVFYFFLAFRAVVAFLDLLGILAIGFLATSVALFISDGSDSNRVIEIGTISFPAISASSLPIVSALILSLFISKAIISVLLTRSLAHFLARIEARAARSIAERAFGKGLEGARQYSTDEIVFAVQVGSPSAFNSLLNSVGTLVAEGFLFILVLGSFALVSPLAALVAVFYFGLIGFLIQFFIGGLMHRMGKKVADSTVEANVTLSSFGDVIREASILGKRDFFYDRIYDARVKASSSNATQFVLSGMPRYIVEAALIVAIAGFIMIQVSNGDIGSSAATLGIFLSGGLRLTASLLPLQSALLTINQSLPPALRALRFIDELTKNPSSPPKSQEIVDDDHPLSIFVDNATFTYKGSDTETLKGISLKIQAGSQAAFIGVSGAGKSTLADLVLGLLKPTGGSVLIDNIDAAKLVESNPGLVSYVPQKPGMISGTLAENIALGINSDQINQKRLAQAIDDSHLRELIDSLPEGVNTDLGKRKDEFSGGQLQRVGLARALYCKPRLLVMDEATSALDAESENEINKALEQMRGKVTVILIAHRLNTIQRSDTVFLMEDGKITDSGTFPELLRSNSTVQNLAKLMAIDSASDLKM